ncbi:MAG: RimK family alpha-L-glutamate ligase [Pirellulaceae bacterium]|nr:RimK family alpha-L-glutamate ligase [Pirellulaceae bacterium]
MSRNAIILGDPQGRYVKRLLNSAPPGIVPLVAEFSAIEATLTHSDERTLESLCIGGMSLQAGDMVLVRSMSRGTLESIVFRMDALAAIERQGVIVYNPAKSLELAIDKYLSLSRLAAAGFPVPATHVSETSAQAIDAFVRLGSDVVVKPMFGSEGRGLIRVCDKDHAFRVFCSLEALGSVIYQQAFIDHGGSDYRVLVIGDRQWIIERTRENDWRTNITQGGRYERTTLPAHVLDLAVQVAGKLGLLYAGIDLVRDRKNGTYLVLEANGVPGWDGVAQAYGQKIELEIWRDLIRYT